jgi:hypothetical protein
MNIDDEPVQLRAILDAIIAAYPQYEIGYYGITLMDDWSGPRPTLFLGDEPVYSLRLYETTVIVCNEGTDGREWYFDLNNPTSVDEIIALVKPT